MRAFQATRTLCSQDSTGTIPVILVTSKTAEADRIWGLRQGARDYLTKPVQARELLSAIDQAIAA